MAACCIPPALPTAPLPSPFQCACECMACHQPCQPHKHVSKEDTVATAVAPLSSSSSASASAAVPSSADPLPLFRRTLADPSVMARLGDEALAYAMTHAITLLRHPPADAAPGTGPAIIHAPLTLLPHRLPAHLFEQVRALTPQLSLLYERVSRDRAWLTETLAETVTGDAFVGQLLSLMNRVASTPSRMYKAQTLSLAINRSDYMLTQHAANDDDDDGGASDGDHLTDSARLLQVEFNTISCGAGSLCNRVADMHRFLIDRYVQSPAEPQIRQPVNEVITNLAAAMAHAHRLFLEQRVDPSAAPSSTVVLFVVQKREANMSDQRQIEYALWEKHRVPVRRITLDEVEAEAQLDERTGHLWLPVQGGSAPAPFLPISSAAAAVPAPARQLVSVIYFRSGYTPRDFTSAHGAEWTALERMERSVAIKCPSIAYHLSGTKKVQQVLTAPGVLERFLPGEDAAAIQQRSDIRAVFAGMWRPDAEIVARALAHPGQFVLKPQREGGGNNLWGSAMVAELQSKSLQELQIYVLMERIGGPHCATPAAVLKAGVVHMLAHTVSELGMMGCVITDVAAAAAAEEESSGPAASVSVAAPAAPAASVFHRNSFAGYLLRTKEEALTEGGLMAGSGAIDSIVLI